MTNPSGKPTAVYLSFIIDHLSLVISSPGRVWKLGTPLCEREWSKIHLKDFAVAVG